MDYAKQSNKEHPFEGLTQEERKRLFVYMCHVAHPNLSPDEIRRKWGEVLQTNEYPTVFEALEIAKDIKSKQEIKESSLIETSRAQVPQEEDWGGCGCIVLGLFILLIGLVFAVMFLMNSDYMRERSQHHQEQKQRQEEYDRQHKAQLQLTPLKEEAVRLLSNDSASSTELLNMGLRVQASFSLLVDLGYCKSEVFLGNRGYGESEVLYWKDLLLQCYKSAISRFHRHGWTQRNSATEASYRVALLYLPSKYWTYLKDEADKRVVLSEDKNISMQYLKKAIDNNHYGALSLISKILLRDMTDRRYTLGDDERKKLCDDIAKYKEQLARHTNATVNDIYDYAKLISESNIHESMIYMKKAAKMGDSRARQELLNKGLTIDE